MNAAPSALARAIEEALARLKLPASQISDQLAGSQVAPAAPGLPGVVDRDDLVTLSSATPQPLGTASAGDDPDAARADHIHAHGDLGGGSLHSVATSGAAGFMAASDKSKLDGVAAGATANASDAQLRDRATHTGTQAAATISDLPEAVQDLIGAAITAGASNVTVSYNDTTGETTISVAIPSASEITSGTLADARLSSNVALKNAANTFTANQAITGTLTASDDLFAKGDSGGLFQRSVNHWTVPIDHFTGFSGWTWAGSPFNGAPNTVNTSSYPSLLYLVHNAVNTRHFAYKSCGSPVSIRARLARGTDSVIGLRVDDGTDNKYIELQLGTGPTVGSVTLAVAYRNGGSITTTSVLSYMQQFCDVTIYRTAGAMLVYFGIDTPILQYVWGLFSDTWTPSRAGILYRQLVDTTGDRCGFVDLVIL